MHQFLVRHGLQLADGTQHGAGMADGFDHVARAGFALGADHGRAFPNAAQGFAQVAAAADKRHLEIVLEDVMFLVGGSEHLGFINVVHTQGFQDLRLDEMPDAAFRHDRDGDSVHDPEDQFRVGHARHAPLGTDIRRDAFQRHDCAGAGLFGNFGMLGGDHVHDHAAFQHLRQTFFYGKCTGLLFHRLLLYKIVLRNSTTPVKAGWGLTKMQNDIQLVQ